MYRFFDVFKTLRLPEDVSDYFEKAEVVKVTKTSTNSLAKIYIKSDVLIFKSTIFKVEEALKKQIFKVKSMDVRIIDRYNLSKQYTPSKIMEIYFESMLFELEKYWTLEFNLLRTAEWVFEKEDELTLILEDSFLAQKYSDSLKDYFEKVFLNRFGFEIDVVYRYGEKKENRYKEESDYQLKLRVRGIEDQVRARAGDQGKGISDEVEAKNGNGSNNSDDSNNSNSLFD